MHVGWARALALDCGAWAIWGLASGWTLHRVGFDRLDHDTWLTQARRWERGGRAYRRWLRVHRWQRRLPEAGAVFRRGRDKRVVGGRATPVLQLYAAETRRAEYVHWLGVAVAPVFALWNPAGLSVAMAAYAGAANLPCIVSLRANRLRVLGVLARRA